MIFVCQLLSGPYCFFFQVQKWGLKQHLPPLLNDNITRIIQGSNPCEKRMFFSTSCMPIENPSPWKSKDETKKWSFWMIHGKVFPTITVWSTEKPRSLAKKKVDIQKTPKNTLKKSDGCCHILLTQKTQREIFLSIFFQWKPPLSLVASPPTGQLDFIPKKYMTQNWRVNTKKMSVCHFNLIIQPPFSQFVQMSARKITVFLFLFGAESDLKKAKNKKNHAGHIFIRTLLQGAFIVLHPGFNGLLTATYAHLQSISSSVIHTHLQLQLWWVTAPTKILSVPKCSSNCFLSAPKIRFR